mgnify:CR=1 FL=1
MLRLLFKLIYKLKGYSFDFDYPSEANRCVLICAPHTSNWDFLFTIAVFTELKIPYRFTIKDDWMKFPFGMLIRPLGGIAINRKPKVEGEERESHVDAMARLFDTNSSLALLVTPEGTRKKVKEIKTGFYYLAQKAQVPMCFGYIDYKNKVAGIKKVLDPSLSLAEVKEKMYDFFSKIEGKNNELNSFIK